MDKNGGYIGVYSRDRTKAVCHVGGGIYLIGQIRLEGRYVNGIFVPKGYEDIDISVHPYFIDLCNRHFPSEGSSWAGGDTFGWFEGATESK